MTQQTPNLGLTYPEAGDHTRIWEHIQALADDVDGLFPAYPAGSAVPGNLTDASVSTSYTLIGSTGITVDAPCLLLVVSSITVSATGAAMVTLTVPTGQTDLWAPAVSIRSDPYAAVLSVLGLIVVPTPGTVTVGTQIRGLGASRTVTTNDHRIMHLGLPLLAGVA